MAPVLARRPRAPIVALEPLVGMMVDRQIPHFSLGGLQHIPVDVTGSEAAPGPVILTPPGHPVKHAQHGQADHEDRHADGATGSTPVAVTLWETNGGTTGCSPMVMAASSAANPSRAPSSSRANTEATASPAAT